MSKVIYFRITIRKTLYKFYTIEFIFKCRFVYFSFLFY